MAAILHMSKDDSIAAANRLNLIKQEHESNISKMRILISELKNGWTADSEIAYEECFTSMTSSFNKYSQLLEDYSNTLTRITQNTFLNDSQHASEIYANFRV